MAPARKAAAAGASWAVASRRAQRVDRAARRTLAASGHHAAPARLPVHDGRAGGAQDRRRRRGTLGESRIAPCHGNPRRRFVTNCCIESAALVVSLSCPIMCGLSDMIRDARKIGKNFAFDRWTAFRRVGFFRPRFRLNDWTSPLGNVGEPQFYGIRGSMLPEANSQFMGRNRPNISGIRA